MLTNKRHEQFSQCVALGANSAAECYTSAGYQQDRVAAEMLTKTKVIAARVAEIKESNATAT